MSKPRQELIRAVQLKKIYQDNGVPVPAVRGINLTIYPGDFLVIAGPSGSGKTTLLNMLGALDAPTDGEVIFEGESLYRKSRQELADWRLQKIGFVFQAYNLIPVLTALENVEFPMMLRGIPEKERRQRALQVLEELGIGELAHKRPNEMSGGQQQRVAVARAIVNQPQVVLADEPTANLDSHTGNALLELMERMNREKHITFVFSSHDPKVIQRAKRLVWLEDGVIKKEEAPAR